MVFELALTGCTDHMTDSPVNEGAAEANSKTSVSIIWVDGEDNK